MGRLYSGESNIICVEEVRLAVTKLGGLPLLILPLDKVNFVSKNPCDEPFYSKEYWEYSALVLKKRAYPTIGDVILELFDWLKDINWPGSMTIKEILYSIPRNILIKYLEEVIDKANSIKDVVWLENLYNFSIELNIKETEFKNKKTSKILNNLDNKNLSTD